MKLRAIVAKDIPRLVRLDSTCFPEGVAFSSRDFTRYLTVDNSVGFLFEEGQQLVGFTLAVWRDKVGEIVTIDVDPQQRRKGFAMRLLDRIEQRLADVGVHYVLLHVDVHNDAAARLYKKRSYERVGRQPKYYRNEHDALIMAKSVC